MTVGRAAQARSLVVAFVALACGSSCTKAPPDAGAATLEFLDEGRQISVVTLTELQKRIPVETLTAYDPYYGKPKTFRVLAFDKVLKVGFPQIEKLGERELLLRAKDGYTVPMRPPLSTEPGAYIAIADVDAPGWEPIGPQRANPAPFYFVWKEPSQQNLETHPRPWQLAAIEIARFEVTFPHTIPSGEGNGSPAWKGFHIFRDRCIRCHAVNREGGRVGPELNVPKNVLEYRTAAEVRAYVKNPLSLRYGNMPAHPDLSEADLDGLIAYFTVMKGQKHDPAASSDGGH